MVKPRYESLSRGLGCVSGGRAGAKRAPVRERRSHADGVNPGSKRRAAVEIRQLAMDDDERVLADVVQVRARHAETSQRAQHEVLVSVEDGSKLEPSRGLRLKCGRFY